MKEKLENIIKRKLTSKEQGLFNMKNIYLLKKQYNCDICIIFMMLKNANRID